MREPYLQIFDAYHFCALPRELKVREYFFAERAELEFLNVSWGRKSGVDLSLPPFFSMYIKVAFLNIQKRGEVGDHPNSGYVTNT